MKKNFSIEDLFSTNSSDEKNRVILLLAKGVIELSGAISAWQENKLYRDVVVAAVRTHSPDVALKAGEKAAQTQRTRNEEHQKIAKERVMQSLREAQKSSTSELSEQAGEIKKIVLSCAGASEREKIENWFSSIELLLAQELLKVN